MNIDFRHLYDADGIGQNGFCLTVLIARCVNLQFGSLGKFLIVILEKTNQHLDGVLALKNKSRSHNAGGVAIQHEGLQAGQLRSNGIDGGIWTILKEDGTLLEWVAPL